MNKPYSSSSTSTYPSKVATKLELKEETTKPIKVDVKGKAKFESSQPAKSHLGHGHIASQCPNKKVMIVLDAIKEIISEEESNQEVEEGEELVAHLKEGELFIIRRNLTMQARKEEEQWDNLFHTRSNVNGKVCELIIDSRTCTNVASTTLVSKLNLANTKHLYPYHLLWLNNRGALKVTE